MKPGTKVLINQVPYYLEEDNLTGETGIIIRPHPLANISLVQVKNVNHWILDCRLTFLQEPEIPIYSANSYHLGKASWDKIKEIVKRQ